MAKNGAKQPLVDNNNRKKSSQTVRYRSQSVEYDGGVFDIDMDIDDGNAFDSISYSDDDEEESLAIRSTNSDYHSYGNGRAVSAPNAQKIKNAQKNNGHHMAYSLPIQIQVPKWRTFYNNQNIDEEEVPMNADGEAIAESIKKLAKSVRNESDIFGDRPRRRLNTGDLIKSRPI
ncbi:uncharacterized protein LOC128951882 isoform X2 [Oppia nitens]|nr:uncharacterized protein LOC128951882 isoform X2 [Oppia nitens]XP_054153150.1 uncharacterized protein LOC128951882 isoform X2 [Oppia nitens]